MGTAPRHAHPLRGAIDAKQLEPPRRGFTWREIPTLGPYLHVAGARTWAMAKHAVSLAPALAKKPRRRLPSNVVACMIGRDRNLTELWREHGEIPARLAGNGFASVISPAFSTWHNVPALDG